MSTIVSFPKLGWSFPLNRVAFSIGGFDVYWYGILIGVGLLLGVWYALRHAREFGIDSDRMLDVIIFGTIFGIIGARLYYVIFAAEGEFTSLADVLDMRRGGVAFYGMVIGALLSAVVTCKVRKVKLLPMVDVASIGFLIGQGIGRWGNFVNQEAFGVNTSLPWGMTSDTVARYLTAHSEELAGRGIFVDPAMPVHPTFLYESLWCLLGFIVLSRFVKKRRFDGEIALMYFAWNGFGRAFIEGLRTDSLYWGNVRISQLLAVIGAFVSILVILLIRARIRRKKDPEYLKPYGRTQVCADELAALAELRASRAGKKSGERTEESEEEPDEATDEPQESGEQAEEQEPGTDAPQEQDEPEESPQEDEAAAEDEAQKPSDVEREPEGEIESEDAAPQEKEPAEKKPAKKRAKKKKKAGQPQENEEKKQSD